MQPPHRRSRPIQQPLPPERPLDYGRLSDAILVRRAKDGDPLALTALCERHAPRVERLARHVLGPGEDARDAAQEALAKLCERIGQFRGEAAFATWLHRLVLNTCRDVVSRTQARRWEPLEDDRRTAGDVGNPERAAALAELRAELGECLAEIPKRQAEIVLLKDALDLSFEEVSLRAGVPVGTAKCYAHRARERLRRRLEGAPA